MAKRLTEAKDQYAVVSPVTKTGRYLVCARRIGSKERLTPIAECRSEDTALRIVDGLHLRQKEEIKISTLAEAHVNELKAQLAAERAKAIGAQAEAGRLREEVRSLGYRVDTLTSERNLAQARA